MLSRTAALVHGCRFIDASTKSWCAQAAAEPRCGSQAWAPQDDSAVRGADGVEETEIQTRIEIARRDHRDLDAAIEALRVMPHVDMNQLQRFKKRKLRLRDEIALLEDMLIPDIIA